MVYVLNIHNYKQFIDKKTGYHFEKKKFKLISFFLITKNLNQYKS